LKRIAIIGGGISGLTAAFRLKQFDPTVTVDLYETSQRLGGAIRTEKTGGFLLEHGADMVATDPPAAIELCRDLGIDDELITPLPRARGAAVVHQGKLVKIPDGFVLMRPTRLLPMVKTPLLSVVGKLRLMMEPLIGRRTSEGDESIGSFVTRRLGKETLDRIVQPLVGGIYTGDVWRLSMAATMPQFWEMERRDGSLYKATRRRTKEGSDSAEQNSAGARYEKFRSFPEGMQRLTRELAERLDPQRTYLSTSVQQVVKDNGVWRLQLGVDRLSEPFDHVIVATPAKTAASLLASAVPEASRGLNEIPFASSAVVVLGLNEADIKTKIDVAGFVVPIIERRPVLAVSFTGDKFAGRTPAGQKLIRVFIGGELQKDLLLQSDEELVQLATNELKSLLGFAGEPIMANVIRWTDAMPQYYVGHLDRIAMIEAEIAKQPGLSIIGNSLHGVGIAPTIAQATKVARAIVQQ
jgi:oxygen-dependent protoporphyrinogen oxidase